jgi:hypothetical protein
MNEQNVPSTDAEIAAHMASLPPDEAASMRRLALSKVATAMKATDPFSVASQCHRESGLFVLPTEEACRTLLTAFKEKHPECFSDYTADAPPPAKDLRESLQRMTHEQYLALRKSDPGSLGMRSV